MNEKLTYKATPIIEGDTIKIREELNGNISEVIVNTREKAIREALVALGWTPPKDDQK